MLDSCQGPAAALTLYSIAPPPLSVASIVIDPRFEGHEGCVPAVVISIDGGGTKNNESYKINALPSPPSPDAPLCVILIPLISVPAGTNAVNG